MKYPLVSIVIPVYNRENIISDAIRSAMSQTYENIEIIIVDNNSTDNTWKVLQEYAKLDNRIKIFQNNENIGPVLNWNECFKKARGEYIKIQWSDDWMNDKFVEKAIALFDGDTAFVLSGYSVTDGIKSIIDIDFKPIYDTISYIEMMLSINKYNFPVSPGCAVFRRRDILENFYCDAIPNGDNLNSMNNGAGNDLLLYLTVALKYKYIKTTETIDNYFRTHSSSFSISDKKISIYYCWALLYFIKTNDRFSHYNNIFKVNIFFKKMLDKMFLNAYKSIGYDINSYKDIIDIIRFLFKKIFLKINTVFSK